MTDTHHLTDAELRDWRDGLPSGRDRIVAHLAICDACGSRLAELLRTAPAVSVATSFDADAFAEAGRRAGEFRAGSRRRFWRYVPAAAAAAAVLVLAVYLAPMRRDAAITRGSDAVHVLEPSGNVDGAALTFSWEGPAGAYRLRVFDLATPDVPVVSRDGVSSGYQLTAEERAALRAGVTYRWFVESASGLTSPAGRFTLR